LGIFTVLGASEPAVSQESSPDQGRILWEPGAVLARLDLRIACIGPDARPARFPARLRTALERYRQTEDQTEEQR